MLFWPTAVSQQEALMLLSLMKSCGSGVLDWAVRLDLAYL